jgi:AraC family transcriptional regulator
MEIYIKNMVCDRCISAVRRHLDQLNLSYKNVQLGRAELVKELSKGETSKLREILKTSGFELLDDERKTIVEQIKNTIISLIHGYDAEELNIKLSVLLQKKLKKEYQYLSTLFSSVEGITIEKYAILQRVEKAKELIMYGELSISEIADELHYSSVQHLSQQFKKVTGLTPSEFKQLKENNRKPLDKV